MEDYEGGNLAGGGDEFDRQPSAPGTTGMMRGAAAHGLGGLYNNI